MCWYILTYIYAKICICLHVCIFMHICIYTYIHIYVHTFMFTCIYMCQYIIYECIHTCIVCRIYIFKYIYVFLHVQSCLLIYSLVHTSDCVCLSLIFLWFRLPFSRFSFYYPYSLVSCTGGLTCMAIRSAACRACLIASPISITMLCGLGTTRRRDAATTAHSTPSTCRATACACSAPVARTRTVLVLSIALSSRTLGAPSCNSPIAVWCSVLQCVPG